MKKQYTLFFTALMFYTRLPVPSGIDHSADLLNKSTRYFPFIGAIVAAFTCFTYWSCSFFLPKETVVLLAMATSVWVTGAFHEDGFADVCDGFGGGWTKDKILEIMKDSRVGAYGAIGMILLLGIKFSLLKEFDFYQFVLLSFTAHCVSRGCATSVIFFGEYAREDAESKAKPISTQMSLQEYLFACIAPIACLGFCGMTNIKYIALFILPLLMTVYLFRFFKKWVGGYTGDCLGATQQLTEIMVYIGFFALQNLI